MAKPSNAIKTIKDPSDNTSYEIIPSRLQNGSYVASLPTLSGDKTIALTDTVSAATTGTSTTEAKYLTINGTEWKLPSGGGSSGVTSFNTRTGAVTLSSSDVTTALGFTPPSSDTRRAIKVNGTQILSSTSTTALDLIAGTNITLTNSSGKVTIDASGGGSSGVTSIGGQTGAVSLLWGLEAYGAGIRVSTNDLDQRYAQTCLVEGALITMADDSKKKIEDIRCGELVKGYDVFNKEYVTTPVIKIEMTGSDVKTFQPHLFSNGSLVNIFKTHSIYSIDREYPTQIENLRYGSKVYDINGNEVIFEGKMECRYNLPRRRFGIITGIGTYFANDILFSIGGHALYQRVTYKLQMPKKALDLYLLNEKEYEDYIEYKNNPEYLKDAIRYISIINRSQKTIDLAQDWLNKTDYKAIKHSEGLISDEEYAETYQRREELRSKINTRLDECREAKEALKALDERFSGEVKKGDRHKELYRTAFARLLQANTIIMKDTSWVKNEPYYWQEV